MLRSYNIRHVVPNEGSGSTGCADRVSRPSNNEIDDEAAGKPAKPTEPTEPTKARINPIDRLTDDRRPATGDQQPYRVFAPF